MTAPLPPTTSDESPLTGSPLADGPLVRESETGALPDPGEPSRARRFGSRVWGPLLVVTGATAALLLAGQAGKSEPAAAQDGDCVHELGSGPSARMGIVDCTKPEADYKVIKVLRAGHSSDPCQWQGFGVFGSYTETRRSGTVTLCLGLNGDRPGGPLDDIPAWAKQY
ncbi:LppU/SCO3897 family protein [Kitasatospora aburaviensis]|uniref:Uncharacterized protein n=1 Tax=Kitasatospora aburaviensis TaxID=67265 RepID=A0ABW1F5P6_9ACTN